VDAERLKQWIIDQKTASVPAPPGFVVSVGAVVPPAIQLYSVPAPVVLRPLAAGPGITPIGTNQYAVIDNKIVLVNPMDRRILQFTTSVN
jgi:hypothetical protein